MLCMCAGVHCSQDKDELWTAIVMGPKIISSSSKSAPPKNLTNFGDGCLPFKSCQIVAASDAHQMGRQSLLAKS